MEIVESDPGMTMDDILDRPLFCYLGTVSEECEPRVSPLWFDWVEQAIWMIGDMEGKSYVGRVDRNSRTAIAIVDFDVRTGRVQHVGMRGHTSIEPFSRPRAEGILQRYLGPDADQWEERFRRLDPDRWCLLRFDPETVVLRDQSYQLPEEEGHGRSF